MEIICFCTDILAENGLSLVLNEITAGRYNNKDIGHTLMKLTTKGHSRVHIIMIDTNEAGERTPPRLWDYCVAGLQGQTFRDKTGLKDILPPDGPYARMFKDLPGLLQTMDVALSDLNRVNRKVVIPRDYFGESMNLGPFMLQIRNQYEPHLCCRHRVGVYTKLNIDENLEDQEPKFTDDGLQRLRDRHGIRTSPRIALDTYDSYTYGNSEEGDNSEDSDSDLEPLYSSNHPGNVIITVQPGILERWGLDEFRTRN